MPGQLQFITASGATTLGVAVWDFIKIRLDKVLRCPLQTDSPTRTGAGTADCNAKPQ